MAKARFKPVTDRRSDRTWRRWLGPGSPLRGGAGLAALATAKIHCHSPTLNSQTGSLVRGLPAETTRSGKGIAAEGHLGSWTHVSKLVGQKKV